MLRGLLSGERLGQKLHVALVEIVDVVNLPFPGLGPGMGPENGFSSCFFVFFCLLPSAIALGAAGLPVVAAFHYFLAADVLFFVLLEQLADCSPGPLNAAVAPGCSGGAG